MHDLVVCRGQFACSTSALTLRPRAQAAYRMADHQSQKIQMLAANLNQANRQTSQSLACWTLVYWARCRGARRDSERCAMRSTQQRTIQGLTGTIVTLSRHIVEPTVSVRCSCSGYISWQADVESTAFLPRFSA